MRALDRKMWRDLWHLRGQSLAIALVISCGIATYIMFLATLDSLNLTRSTFYEEYRFAQLFTSLKRAPESLRNRILEIPGVAAVETRVVSNINLDIASFGEPVTGRLISIPDHGEPALNNLYLRAGRLPDQGHEDEVVISETFAQAHGLKPGDTLTAILNGKRKGLTIVGIAISPEYIYQLRPGSAWPDFKRYGILWMGRRGVASAFDMEGAFNDVVLSLSSDAQYNAQHNEIIDRLDDLLRPYGGFGAYGREDQISNNFLSEEFNQLQRNAAMFPVIFLSIAVFLLNVVISRLIMTQREQIAALKAFGYTNLTIGLHFFKLVMVIVLIGILGGIALGIWLAQGMSNVYMTFFRFPYLLFDLRADVIVMAVFATVAAALLGTFFAVRAGARLQPAEAMRPAPPTTYRKTVVERIGIGRWLSQPSRMILRHIERRPLKSLLTIIGIAFACGINMTGQFQQNTVAYMMELHYGLAQRQDLSVTFIDPTSQQALHNLQRMGGIEKVEGFRLAPVRLKHEHRSHRTGLFGIRSDGDLRRLLDSDLHPVQLPREGIVMTDFLGQMLGIKAGDVITVEILEGNRPLKQVPVVALVKEYLGVTAYMDIDALNRLMKEGHAVSGAYLAIDWGRATELFHTLKQTPRVAIVTQRRVEIENFNKTMDETMIFITTIATVFAIIISFGVVYNSARIAITERGRELASLRVLGFTRAEISYILLGELALLTLIAIPLGWLVGYSLCGIIAVNLQSELYRVPTIINHSTYAFATTVVLISALLSGLLVRRQLDRLDLISVLKTKE
jgi:putative ABC transport system permease protein